MRVPLEIAYANLAPSAAVEASVKARLEKLERLFDRLLSCRVVVTASPRHRPSHQFGIRVEMAVPGDYLVIDRQPGLSKDTRETDFHGILRTAFEAAERRLKAYKARLRGPVHRSAARLEGMAA